MKSIFLLSQKLTFINEKITCVMHVFVYNYDIFVELYRGIMQVKLYCFKFLLWKQQLK
jgi:hypothetical protein